MCANQLVKNCTQTLMCFTCTRLHLTILHRDIRNYAVVDVINGQDKIKYSESRQPGESKVCSARSQDREQVSCLILPVIHTNHAGKQFIVYCALDPCTTDTWMTIKLLHEMSKPSAQGKLNLSTLHATNKEILVKVLHNLSISDCDNTYSSVLSVVYTKPDYTWPFSPEDVPNKRDIEKNITFERHSI